jgi:LysR family glycine cleavage system transcriptional activator
MARPLPPLDLLVGFEAAARQLSFSKAGDEVFVTQSAISRQVKKLEDYLGVVLFERRHRALELTEQGWVLYKVVRESLTQLSATVETLRTGSEGRGIRVTSTTAFASLWLVPRLARLRAQHPEIALHIEADNRIVDPKQGNADLSIRYCTPDKTSPETDILLTGEEIFPVCSPALLARNGRSIVDIEDLRHHTLLHLSDPHNAWPWLQWSNWLEGVGSRVAAGDIGLRFSHLDQMIQAATMGHGVALGSSPLVDYLLAEGALVAPLSQRLVGPRSFFLCPGQRCDTSVKSFVAWLQDSIVRPVPGTA